MNTFTNAFDDPLKPLGMVAGSFLVLVAIGTIVSQPWTTQTTIASAAIRVVGALLMGLLGGGLAYLSWADGE